MPYDTIGNVRTAIESLENLRRLTEPFDGPAGLIEMVRQRQSLYDQIDRDLIQSSNFRSLVDHVSACDLQSAISLSADDTVSSSLRDTLQQLNSPLGLAGVVEAIRATSLGELRTQLASAIDPTAATIASSLNFDHLTNPESFARVGVASVTAAHAFEELGPFNPSFDSFTDSFFGDWTRSPSLPTNYGDDDAIREEVIEQIDADKALLEISPEEAGSIIEESNISASGTPLRIFGSPVGIVFVQRPETVVFEVITEFERRLRKKVDKTMMRAYGESWIADKFPDKHEVWSERRQDDEDNGLKTHSLIEYSDFTELASVIESQWSNGFARSGVRPRDINKSVSALNPHRRYTMHSRNVYPEQIFGVVHHIQRIETWLLEDHEEE